MLAAQGDLHSAGEQGTFAMPPSHLAADIHKERRAAPRLQEALACATEVLGMFCIKTDRVLLEPCN